VESVTLKIFPDHSTNAPDRCKPSFVCDLCAVKISNIKVFFIFRLFIDTLKRGVIQMSMQRLNLTLRISVDVKFGGTITFKCTLQIKQETVSSYLFSIFLFCFSGAFSTDDTFDNDNFSAFEACKVHISFLILNVLFVC